jgi:sialate O-acetylesterase
MYNCTFPAMIHDWRTHFSTSPRQSDPLFPFGFVQLAADHDAVPDLGFPLIRWSQTRELGMVPNPTLPEVFMAVAYDLGDATSPFGAVHPRYKQEVGLRLALAARAIAYKEQDLCFTGPLFSGFKADPRVPGAAWVSLDTNNCGDVELRSTDPTVVAFELCGDGNTCDIAQAASGGWVPGTIIQESWYNHEMVLLPKDTAIVTVLSTNVSKVTAVRYAWSADPCPHLGGAVYANGLPLPPFFARL